MGMGYVSTGSVPQEGHGAHLPRRKRRGSGTPRSRAAHRRRLGDFGEEIAARFLLQKGCVVLGRNIRAGRGEIDLIVKDGSVIVAVEVKTGTTAFEHFTDAKVETLRRTMQRLRPSPRRLDLITVTPDAGRATIRWFRGVG